MELLAKKLPEIKLEPGVQRITYIATEFDKDKGWDSYKSVTDNFDAPVYLLTPDLITRFELEHTPSVITPEARSLLSANLLRRAVNDFCPAFQPIKDVGTGSFVAAEVLARWYDEGRVLTPSSLSSPPYWGLVDMEMARFIQDNLHYCLICTRLFF